MAGGGPAIIGEEAEIRVESGTAASAKNAQRRTPSVGAKDTKWPGSNIPEPGAPEQRRAGSARLRRLFEPAAVRQYGECAQPPDKHVKMDADGAEAVPPVGLPRTAR